MRLPNEPDLPPQINIVPMIDVIFAILTFFIMSSLFLTRSQGLPVNLPTTNTVAPQTDPQLVVTIDAQGNVFLNQQAIAPDLLSTAVQDQIASGIPAFVVINADAAVNHGRVVQVMDELRNIQGLRLAIATEQASE
jgi:biopolymer transport protein ExbD